MSEFLPCPGCGWPSVRMIGKTQTKVNESGLSAEEDYSQYEGIYGYRRISNTVEMRDFRHGFYCRCNRCGWRSPVVWTPWHIRTQEEAGQWNRSEKYFGFEQSSDWAKPYRDEARNLWNTRCTTDPYAFPHLELVSLEKLRTGTFIPQSQVILSVGETVSVKREWTEEIADEIEAEVYSLLKFQQKELSK